MLHVDLDPLPDLPEPHARRFERLYLRLVIGLLALVTRLLWSVHAFRERFDASPRPAVDVDRKPR